MIGYGCHRADIGRHSGGRKAGVRWGELENPSPLRRQGPNQPCLCQQPSRAGDSPFRPLPAPGRRRLDQRSVCRRSKSRRRGVVRFRQVTRRQFVDTMRVRIAVEDEAAVAIAAIDIALLVDLQPHARMTESGGAIIPGGTDIAGPIAGNAAGIGMDGFRGCAHALAITKARRGFPVGIGFVSAKFIMHQMR